MITKNIKTEFSYIKPSVIFCTLILLVFSSISVLAQNPETAAQDKQTQATQKASAQKIYSQAKKAIYQIRVINSKSNQKSSIGSGFRMSPHGYFITNYHVVSLAALKPDEYRLEIQIDDTKTTELKIRNLDVIHDLAILEMIDPSALPNTGFLSFSNKKLEQGETIYSIGNPQDVGMTIIDGVYNGYLAKSFHKKILFSGALNAGMSGGPALDADGKIVGVNVATSGDNLSYLVPAEYAKPLIKTPSATEDWDAVITKQLTQNANLIAKNLLSTNWGNKEFSKLTIPNNLIRSIKCWGNGKNESKEINYSSATFYCGTQDSVYISPYFQTNRINYSFSKVGSKALNKYSFSRLLASSYQYVDYYSPKEKEQIGNFSCKSSFVEVADYNWKMVLCTRPYKKYKGLYDTVVKAAVLQDDNEAYLFEISLDGFTKNNTNDFIKKFLETIK
jgi:hypothetical protein